MGTDTADPGAPPEPEHRAAWLAIPGPRPGTTWVTGEGGLPFVRFDIDVGTSTVRALATEVLPRFGLAVPILSAQLKYDRPWTPATVVSVLAELEPPPQGWVAPAGWQIADVREPSVVAALAAAVHPGLHPRLVDWAAEQAGAPVDPLVPPWAHPGWWAAATGWIADRFPDRGPWTFEQARAWGISTVLRATAADGSRRWFKGVCDHFAREVPITALIDRLAPGVVAPVLVTDPERHWMVLGDLAEATVGDPASHATAFAQLRALQAAVAGHHDRLVAAGAVVRPVDAVPAAFAEVVADPGIARWHDVPPDRVGELVEWVAAAADEVARLDLPVVLVHGDFHPGNVAGGDRRVIFDWSDAALSAPFVDVPTWLSWIDDDFEPAAAEALRVAVWESFAAGWADVLAPTEWLARRALLEGLAGAYHVVSYAGIIRAMDPHRKAEHGPGIADFLGFVDRAAPRRGH